MNEKVIRFSDISTVINGHPPSDRDRDLAYESTTSISLVLRKTKEGVIPRSLVNAGYKPSDGENKPIRYDLGVEADYVARADMLGTDMVVKVKMHPGQNDSIQATLLARIARVKKAAIFYTSTGETRLIEDGGASAKTELGIIVRNAAKITIYQERISGGVRNKKELANESIKLFEEMSEATETANRKISEKTRTFKK